MVSEACMEYAREKHYCPHCNTRLSCCSTPPLHIGDGLGWGTEAIFICLNDECKVFVNGWKHFDEQYGSAASCRYMLLPGEKKGSNLMVGGAGAFTGCIIDPDTLPEGPTRYDKEKEALAALDTCVEKGDLEPVLFLITDEKANLENRKKACDLLEDLCDLNCIDPIRNHKFLHTEIGQYAELAIAKILKKSFKKECPHCAEIIKAQAKICKHCGK